MQLKFLVFFSFSILLSQMFLFYFAVSFVGLSRAITPQEYCSSRQSNVQGKPIYLNYWDDYYDYDLRVPINSSEGCCSMCSEASYYDCNAWSYCNKKEGCGTGCSSYMKDWKNALDSGDNTWLDQYGPEVYSDKSRQVDGQCGDKWPYKTCTLKKLATPSDKNSYKEITEGKAAEGWVSGVLSEPDYPGWMCQYNVPEKCCIPPYDPVYQCAGAWCGAEEANLVGAELLVLDVDDGVYHRYGGQYGDTPHSCCEMCRSGGCEGWTYCNRVEGCGSGCKAFLEKLYNERGGEGPPLRTECTDNDAFPFRMCSLKKISGTDYSMKSGKGEEGWVSGIVLPVS
eukprot:TRINITY_DN17501_c0_g1_i1.p1 TRINITY_DN17501_c0_g1~~TRINITY_DN17501_c0_g1_i1.p1  ORF type:complete len:340 (-),score=32.76 TRINITY_DN17501_c0_g1_i1:344-1363(-)